MLQLNWTIKIRIKKNIKTTEELIHQLSDLSYNYINCLSALIMSAKVAYFSVQLSTTELKNPGLLFLLTLSWLSEMDFICLCIG